MTSAPRVGIETHSAAELRRLVAVNDLEVKTEFLPQFLLPLVTQRRRRDNQHSLDSPLKDEFRYDQTRFDRFTQADVVSQKQINARHAHCLQQRDHLVVLNLNGSMERRRKW